MITQEINKYTVEVWRQPAPSHLATHFPPAHTPEKYKVLQMSKLEYALYIQNLPFKKGDLLTSKYTKDVTEFNTYQLADIQELHRFVTWGMPSVGPLCLYLEHVTGNLFYGGAEVYRRVYSHEVPKAWIDKLALRLVTGEITSSPGRAHY